MGAVPILVYSKAPNFKFGALDVPRLPSKYQATITNQYQLCYQDYQYLLR